MLQVIMLAIAAAAIFVIFMLNDVQRKKSYTGYYAAKRREFPWLDNWIKEIADPAKERLNDDKIGNIGAVIIYYAVIAVALKLFPVWGFYGESVTLQIIFTALGIPIAFGFARMGIKNPGAYEHPSEKGLTLECPACGCPHSWVITHKEDIVEDSSTTTTTTTTTRETTGGGLVGASQSILNDGTTTRVDSTTVYSGREIKDFKCLNCGHTEKHEYIEAWTYEPEGGVEECDPLIFAWGGDWVARKFADNQAGKEQKQYDQITQAANKGSGITDELLKLAESGNKHAKFDVGLAYLLGQGVEKNEKKAKVWLPKEYVSKDGSIKYGDLASELNCRGNFSSAVLLYEMTAKTYETDVKGYKRELKSNGYSTVISDAAHAYWSIGHIYDGKFDRKYKYKEEKRRICDKKKSRYYYKKAKVLERMMAPGNWFLAVLFGLVGGVGILLTTVAFIPPGFNNIFTMLVTVILGFFLTFKAWRGKRHILFAIMIAIGVPAYRSMLSGSDLVRNNLNQIISPAISPFSELIKDVKDAMKDVTK